MSDVSERFLYCFAVVTAALLLFSLPLSLSLSRWFQFFLMIFGLWVWFLSVLFAWLINWTFSVDKKVIFHITSGNLTRGKIITVAEITSLRNTHFFYYNLFFVVFAWRRFIHENLCVRRVDATIEIEYTMHIKFDTTLCATAVQS